MKSTASSHSSQPAKHLDQVNGSVRSFDMLKRLPCCQALR
uniref:Uncharacterized protein n=1 Tax=Anguilla anguilla TaxID=7936 RepID=A0A0E9UGM1_ANGAN